MNMLKHLVGLLFALAMLGTAHATGITFSAEFVSGSGWQYHYTVTNDTLSEDIDEFTIYFDRTLYSNLAVEASPTDWDPLVVQPDPGIPSDGFFDALALVGALPLGIRSAALQSALSTSDPEHPERKLSTYWMPISR